jgi:hypothetical protein
VTAPKRCPVCGRGSLVDIKFQGDSDSAGVPATEQGADSPEVVTYSCGHEVRGERLSTADADRLDVERRSSEETVEEPEREEGRPS